MARVLFAVTFPVTMMRRSSAILYSRRRDTAFTVKGEGTVARTDPVLMTSHRDGHACRSSVSRHNWGRDTHTREQEGE
jgi:hypothetical protein